MLNPAPLENVVLFPTVVCVAGIGVGVGLVLVAQPAVVAATISNAATASAASRCDYSSYQLSLYKEIFEKIKVCTLASHIKRAYSRVAEKEIPQVPLWRFATRGNDTVRIFSFFL
jgi:uncharacterized membrane protein